MSQKSRDIEERAFVFACEVVRFCDRHFATGKVKQRLLLQLVDAASSIGANLEEAAAGQTKADFIAKACVARKEARESNYWLRVLSACFPGHADALAPLLNESKQIVAIICAIVWKARSNPHRG